MGSHDASYHLQQMGVWVLIGVLVAIVVLSLWRKGGSARDGGDDSPEEIAKRRYAKGEIDRETYLRILMDLKG